MKNNGSGIHPDLPLGLNDTFMKVDVSVFLAVKMLQHVGAIDLIYDKSVNFESCADVHINWTKTLLKLSNSEWGSKEVINSIIEKGLNDMQVSYTVLLNKKILSFLFLIIR